MHRVDTAGATNDNKFTNGDPSQGIAATRLGATWLNDIQENVAKFIEARGITLVKGDYDQLTQAINDAVSNATIPDATVTKAGKVEIATLSEVNSGTDDVRVVTPKTLADTKFGTNKINAGVFPFARGGTGASTKSGARSALDISNVADKTDGAETSGTHYATGGFQKSSGRHLKKNIRRLRLTRRQKNAARRLQLRQWEWIASGQWDAGIIADEVAEAFPWLVGYDEQGRPASVDYGALGVHLALFDRMEQHRRWTIAAVVASTLVAGQLLALGVFA